MFVIEHLTAAAEDAASSSVLNKKLRSTVHNWGGNSKHISFLIILRKKHRKIKTNFTIKNYSIIKNCI